MSPAIAQRTGTAIVLLAVIGLSAKVFMDRASVREDALEELLGSHPEIQQQMEVLGQLETYFSDVTRACEASADPTTCSLPIQNVQEGEAQ